MARHRRRLKEVARDQGFDCVPGRAHILPVTGYREQVPATQGHEKGCGKSDEAIVALKYVKAYGAKGRNTETFPEGKHVKTLEVREIHGNKTTGYKDIVREVYQTGNVDEPCQL